MVKIDPSSGEGFRMFELPGAAGSHFRRPAVAKVVPAVE